MENLNKNSNFQSRGKLVKTYKVAHPCCNRTFQERTVKISKNKEKTYRVSVTYIEISKQDAQTKRAVIENILKKGHTH